MTASRARPFGENLWLIDGPVVSAYGFDFPTRMAVARLPDGSLWLWSPVQLDDDLRRDIADLGEPRYVVEPNKFHHLALADWKRCWPNLLLFAPPGLARKRRDLHFVAELTSEPPAEWRAEIDQVRVDGSFIMTEVLFFHRPSSTCLVGDLIENHDERTATGWRRWLIKAGGVSGPDGGTARGWRLSFVRRERARTAVSHALAWLPQRLVIAHGPCRDVGGTDALRRPLRWLLDGR
jgi:hypothetical protein